MSESARVTVERLSKKFSKTLRSSIRYAVQDILAELMVFGRSDRSELRPHEFWALQDVSFNLQPGDTLALIGANGAGKSTLLKMLNGLIKPDTGTIALDGRVGALIELGAGFSPVLSGRENVYVNGAILGLSRREIHQKLDAIIDFADLGDFIDAPMRSYSSGMWVRLGYAIASHTNREILLIDEILAVGDMAFRHKCMQHLQRYSSDGGILILVSHIPALLQTICTRGLVFDHGRVRFDGGIAEAVNHYTEMQKRHELSQLQLAQDQAQEAERNRHLVTIESLEIQAADENGIVSGQPVTVSLRYRTDRDFPQVTWDFGIWTGDQWTCITAASSRAAGVFFRLQPGTGEIHFTLPTLKLLSGTYSLKVMLVDEIARAVIGTTGWEDSPLLFTVKSQATATNNGLEAIGALTIADVQWEQ